MRKLLPVLLTGLVLAVSSIALAADAPKKTDAKPEAAKEQPKDQAKADAQQAEQMKASMAFMNDALQAGVNAPKGATPCETAYNGTKAMYDLLKQKMPEVKNKPLPAKDKFVTACKELPEAIQKCIGMSYAMDHVAECQEAQAKMDPAVVAKMKKLAE